MASIYRHTSRNGWCVQICYPTSQCRHVLWLGQITKSAAASVARHLESLAAASRANVQPPKESIRWAMSTDKRIKTKLIEWGLIPNCNLSTHTITTWVDEYCKTRNDVSPKTVAKYKLARKHLLKSCADKDLRSVTKGDADRFARSLNGAASHKGKIVKNVKQIFAAAVADRIIEANPFDHLVGSTAIDQSRAVYVSLDTFEMVQAQIASPECRIAFYLARHAGLRVPSEVYELRWIDIDWAANTLLIHSPKGKRYEHRKTRLIPLFPSIRPILQQMHESAQVGSIHVCERFKDSANKTMRSHLESAIKLANVPQWAKLWNNLRASCRTDLEERFPVHVCDDWLGHSDAVARKHYKRVTPEHFTQAQAAIRAVTGAVKIQD